MLINCTRGNLTLGEYSFVPGINQVDSTAWAKMRYHQAFLSHRKQLQVQQTELGEVPEPAEYFLAAIDQVKRLHELADLWAFRAKEATRMSPRQQVLAACILQERVLTSGRR